MCAMNPRLLRPLATGFSPRQIAGLALWLDAADESTVSHASGTVSSWADKVSGSLYTPLSGDEPLTGSSSLNGKNVLTFDGTDDRLNGPSPTPGATPRSVFVVAADKGSQAFGAMVDLGSGGTSYASYSLTKEPAIRITGAAFSVGPTPISSTGSIVTNTCDGEFNTATLAINGSEYGGTVNSNQTLVTDSTMIIGSRVLASSGDHFGGDIAEIVVYTRVLSLAERQKIEGYLAWKWGLQAQLPSNHPYAYSFPGFGSQARPDNGDALAWESAVYANSGSVSVGTLAAVNTFCNAIDAASIRDRFYRLNLFAGTGLNAALVPLYRGPSRTGTQYGNATDTNNGPFVSGDYAETGASGGLKGNGTSKYLDTGLPMNYPATNGDRHLGIYKTLLATQTAASIAAVDSASPLTLYQLLRLSTQIQYFSGGNTTNAVQTDAVGHWLAMGTVNKSLYLNGVEQVSNSTGSDTVNTATRSFYVFARNDSGTTNIYSNERQAAYSIGSSMNATQAAGFYTAMQAFQTALGRNV